MTLDDVLAGKVTMGDLRITPSALEQQAQVAEAAGRRQLAENLRRAAELAAIPEEFVLRVYDALRPGRADRGSLESLAGELEARWGAVRCAALVREAAAFLSLGPRSGV